MECEKNVFALFAHLKKDSIRVSTGQDVVSGDVLGQVGHSGNSTAPHLHFQLMDSSDLIVAKGVPFLFREYQLSKGSTWSTVLEGVPSNKDRIKH
jgi:murein DD-endopeptidase MepM/ murein hydrolase activator NlpD